jgi:hypothetical protein
MPSSSSLGRTAALAAAMLGLAIALAGPAAADPKGEVVPVDCGETTYLVAVSGNGQFSPGHDTASTSILIPVSFGEFTGTITDEEGTVIESFVDPAVSKGPGAAAKATVDCTFSFSETFEEPELGPGTFTFTGSGSVQGFVTPRG